MAVASLNFIPFDENESLVIEELGLVITPLVVEHGHNYTCVGFRFGNVVYISDASHIPSATRKLLEGCELLILDALEFGKRHPSHFVFTQSIEEVKKINPKRTYFIGMTHDVDYDAANAILLETFKQDECQLSYDGLCIEVDL